MRERGRRGLVAAVAALAAVAAVAALAALAAAAVATLAAAALACSLPLGSDKEWHTGHAPWVRGFIRGYCKVR